MSLGLFIFLAVFILYFVTKIEFSFYDHETGELFKKWLKPNFRLFFLIGTKK